MRIYCVVSYPLIPVGEPFFKAFCIDTALTGDDFFAVLWRYRGYIKRDLHQLQYVTRRPELFFRLHFTPISGLHYPLPRRKLRPRLATLFGLN